MTISDLYYSAWIKTKSFLTEKQLYSALVLNIYFSSNYELIQVVFVRPWTQLNRKIWMQLMWATVFVCFSKWSKCDSSDRKSFQHRKTIVERDMRMTFSSNVFCSIFIGTRLLTRFLHLELASPTMPVYLFNDLFAYTTIDMSEQVFVLMEEKALIWRSVCKKIVNKKFISLCYWFRISDNVFCLSQKCSSSNV